MLMLESEFIDAVQDYPDVSGLSINVRSMQELYRMALQSMQGVRQPRSVMYLNMHVLHLARGNEDLYDAAMKADFRYCASDGVRLLLDICGEGKVEKLTGAGFYQPLFGLLQRVQPKVYLLGEERSVVESAKDRLNREFDRVEVVGCHHGLLGRHEEERIVNEINRLKPDLLLVGLGTPLQEEWIARNSGRLNVRLCWGVGPLLRYIAGVNRRAPQWMISLNLEWLHRALKEPIAVFRQVFIECPSFLITYFIGRLRCNCKTAKLFELVRRVRLVRADW